MSKKVYEIRHTDNRGISALVGLVTIVLLTKMLLDGLLADLALSAYKPNAEGFSSATYVIVGFIVHIIYGIGVVVTALWSGVWWIAADVISAIRQYASERKAKNEIADSVGQSEIASDIAQLESPPESPIVQALRDLNDNVKTTYEKVGTIEEKMELLEGRIEVVELAKTTRRTGAKP